MDLRFGSVHLDPACDPPEHYAAAFDLFGDLWGLLEVAKGDRGGDEFIEQLVEHLQNQLVGAALLLRIKANMHDTHKEG
jgi:hypothetical protein